MPRPLPILPSAQRNGKAGRDSGPSRTMLMVDVIVTPRCSLPSIHIPLDRWLTGVNTRQLARQGVALRSSTPPPPPEGEEWGGYARQNDSRVMMMMMAAGMKTIDWHAVEHVLSDTLSHIAAQGRRVEHYWPPPRRHVLTGMCKIMTSYICNSLRVKRIIKTLMVVAIGVECNRRPGSERAEGTNALLSRECKIMSPFL